MDITLKFTETNLFLIKMDYLYTVKILLYFFNLKLNLCYAWTHLTDFFLDSAIFCIATLICLLNLGSEMSLNMLNTMLSYSKCWEKVSMGVCCVSLIISDKSPCKMFSNNS